MKAPSNTGGSGAGGNLGVNGTKGYSDYNDRLGDGGAAGKAINVSSGTITWIAKGDVRGAVS